MAYMLLNRPEFGEIVRTHIKHRVSTPAKNPLD